MQPAIAAVPRVLLPARDGHFDARFLPPGFRKRCTRIAAAGLLGVAAACAAAAVLAALLALPLLLFGVPALLAAELVFAIVYFHKLAILNVQPIKHEVRARARARSGPASVRDMRPWMQHGALHQLGQTHWALN
jgi:hypothetical protein